MFNKRVHLLVKRILILMWRVFTARYALTVSLTARHSIHTTALNMFTTTLLNI